MKAKKTQQEVKEKKTQQDRVTLAFPIETELEEIKQAVTRINNGENGKMHGAKLKVGPFIRNAAVTRAREINAGK